MFITTAGWLSFSSQSINNPVNATAQIHTARWELGAVTELLLDCKTWFSAGKMWSESETS